LYSPPLTLSARSNWFEFSGGDAAESSKAPQWPQKRLLRPLVRPQAPHIR